MSKEIVTYQERAGQMTKAARVAACEDAGRAFEKARNAAGNVAELEVVIVNRLREAGLKLNQASGRQQLLFTVGGVEFCRKEILPLLPVGMDLPVVQACVHIANTITQPIASPAELRSYKPALQLAFQTLGLAEGSRRRELQTAHARNLFSDFVDRVAGLQIVMCNLIKTEQMENWPAAKLDEFLEKALPIKQQIERAEKLRLGLQ